MQRWACLVAVVAAFGGWGWAVRGQLSQGGVYADEPNWIGASYVYADLLVHGDFTPEHWDCPDLRAWGNLNPHVGKFILGIPLLIDSYCFNEGARFTRRYDFSQSQRWNLENGNIPGPRILYLARAVSLLLSACAAAAIALCAWRLWGRLASLAVLYLLLLNPLFIRCCGYAFTDPGYLLFNALALVLGICLLTAATPRARGAWACGLGLSVALAAAIKVTGMVLLVAFVGALLAALNRSGRWSVRQTLAGTGAFGLVLVLASYVLNPFCWPDLRHVAPGALGHEIKVAIVDQTPVTFRDGITLWDALTAKDLRREEIRAAYPQLANLVLRPLELPLLLPRWNRLFANVPRTPGLEILKRLAWDYTVFPGEVLFTCLGLAAAVRAVLRTPRHAWPPTVLAPLLMLALQVALLLLKLPVGFDRYYLSAVIFLRLFSAAGVVLAVQWLCGP